jgi:hypothetical protein
MLLFLLQFLLGLPSVQVLLFASAGAPLCKASEACALKKGRQEDREKALHA